MNEPSFNKSDLGDPLICAKDILRKSKRLVVFTGAGISAASGIPTFRDSDGLWARFPPSRFASWSNIIHLAETDPIQLAEFIVAVFKPIAIARPNIGHEAIAALEKYVESTIVITQNIDGLHQLSGSSNVLEIHGSAFEINRRTPFGKKTIDLLARTELCAIIDELESIYKNPTLPHRDFFAVVEPILSLDNGRIRYPNLVLFGDSLPVEIWEASVAAAKGCDCFLIVGTSQLISPASDLPTMAKMKGAKIILVDPIHSSCDVWLPNLASEVLPELTTVRLEVEQNQLVGFS